MACTTVAVALEEEDTVEACLVLPRERGVEGMLRIEGRSWLGRADS